MTDHKSGEEYMLTRDSKSTWQATAPNGNTYEINALQYNFFRGNMAYLGFSDKQIQTLWDMNLAEGDTIRMTAEFDVSTPATPPLGKSLGGYNISPETQEHIQPFSYDTQIIDPRTGEPTGYTKQYPIGAGSENLNIQFHEAENNPDLIAATLQRDGKKTVTDFISREVYEHQFRDTFDYRNDVEKIQPTMDKSDAAPDTQNNKTFDQAALKNIGQPFNFT